MGSGLGTFRGDARPGRAAAAGGAGPAGRLHGRRGAGYCRRRPGAAPRRACRNAGPHPSHAHVPVGQWALHAAPGRGWSWPCAGDPRPQGLSGNRPHAPSGRRPGPPRPVLLRVRNRAAGLVADARALPARRRAALGGRAVIDCAVLPRRHARSDRQHPRRGAIRRRARMLDGELREPRRPPAPAAPDQLPAADAQRRGGGPPPGLQRATHRHAFRGAVGRPAGPQPFADRPARPAGRGNRLPRRGDRRAGGAPGGLRGQPRALRRCRRHRPPGWSGSRRAAQARRPGPAVRLRPRVLAHRRGIRPAARPGPGALRHRLCAGCSRGNAADRPPAGHAAAGAGRTGSKPGCDPPGARCRAADERIFRRRLDARGRRQRPAPLRPPDRQRARSRRGAGQCRRHRLLRRQQPAERADAVSDRRNQPPPARRGAVRGGHGHRRLRIAHLCAAAAA